MKRYALYLFDLDGTLFRGAEPIPGAQQAVARIRASGAAVRFLTNNSSSTPQVVSAKLESLGFPSEASEVVTSAQAAAHLCVQRRISKAFVVGETGIETALRHIGVDSTWEDAQAVVAGICRRLTYDWIERAQQILLAGKPLIATNLDATYPLEAGRLAPGAGATIAALEACGETRAIVAGKPARTMVDLACEGLSVLPSDILLVGDRLDTDIACAQQAGIDSLLVLTGVTADAPRGVPHIQSVAEL